MLTQLLDCWNIITNQNVRMIPAVERALWDYQQVYKETAKADLEMTLNFILLRNKRSDKPWHLRFSKFFDGEYEHFESIRAEAEQFSKAQAAKKRQFRPSAGDKALAEMRHEAVPDGPEQPVKRVSLEFISETIRKGNTTQ